MEHPRTSNELKPCPFCGIDKINLRLDYREENNTVYSFVCHNNDCFAEILIIPRSKFESSRQEAIEVWNKRA